MKKIKNISILGLIMFFGNNAFMSEGIAVIDYNAIM